MFLAIGVRPGRSANFDEPMRAVCLSWLWIKVSAAAAVEDEGISSAFGKCFLR